MDLPKSEIAWRKSSYSGANGSNCVEVATLPGGRRAVRDSKNSSGPVVAVTPSEWQAFLGDVKGGKFE
ncbi:DUF397 domain-containing protein [Sphaerisporangium album]|uniref:DUF397 domain-containing protein n=1 Tax=Sphaerisporangium album TaxID=509200 RepID=A0A367EM70_9ACTN|nr:DUF397 domain-containing protein [Sphaerisporangium album]RCG19164.1 DUF397 domain-containing protein [Sphaerisporangium album]